MDTFTQIIFICYWNIYAVGIYTWDNRGRDTEHCHDFLIFQKSVIVYTFKTIIFLNKFEKYYCFKTPSLFFIEF